jgi:hypothetical protein
VDAKFVNVQVSVPEFVMVTESTPAAKSAEMTSWVFVAPPPPLSEPPSALRADDLISAAVEQSKVMAPGTEVPGVFAIAGCVLSCTTIAEDPSKTARANVRARFIPATPLG